MNNNERFFKSIYDPVTQSLITIPFTEEEIAERILFEQENDRLQREEEWVKVRDERDLKLLKSDWTQLPNAPLTQSKKDEWEAYRQSLRDLPSTITDIYNFVWPIPPA